MIYDIYLLQLGWHPVAVAYFTFTHKQYTELHDEAEHTGYYIHDINITYT
jgi:hypothetical protein